MDILAKAKKLESTLTRTFDRAAQQWSQSGPRGPLEVLHAILEAVDERVEPAGRGRRVFPFNRIKVTVVAPTRDARARLASVLDGGPTLRDRIVNRLRAARCDSTGLSVRLAYVAQPEEGWTTPEFHIDFGQGTPADPAPPEPAPQIPEIELTIAHGAGDKPRYTLTQDRINLGRCAEVRDSRNHLIRTNHVVFKDGAGTVNDTVSRRHAHIDYSEATRDFRIVDDRSAHGTSIVRNGTPIPVHVSSRGVRLQTDDEIVLGEARLRVKVASVD
jgi:pSer/pThr/pTyr-binding forkhead associated (FHA) protein